MSSVEVAKDLATRLHLGQVDKAGAPYIEHCARVADVVEEMMSRLANRQDQDLLLLDCVIVAWLHDTVEDTEIDLAGLERLGFSYQVVSGVDACTRREKETYSEFVERASEHIVGRWVKLADIADHLTKREEDTFVQSKGMTDRYRKAYDFLLNKMFVTS